MVTDGCTHRKIGTVRDAGADASTGLDDNPMALADQLLDGFGRRGNPRLAGMGLERNTDVHLLFSGESS
ncbi:hypothetical protein D3C80_1898480 [compost metagenome]